MADSSTAETLAASRRTRLSERVGAHPLRAIGLAALCAAGVGAGVSAAVRTGADPTAARGGSTLRRAAMPSATRGDVGAAMGRALAGNASEAVSLRPRRDTRECGPLRGRHRSDDQHDPVQRKCVDGDRRQSANSVDMRFRAAGLSNPTIDVPRGALVTIHFINGDSDSAHGWMLLEPLVTVGKVVHGPRAFPGAFALLGDPTSAGQPAATISFRATRSGTYRYECPVPGHAAMGMQGNFVVRSRTTPLARAQGKPPAGSSSPATVT